MELSASSIRSSCTVKTWQLRRRGKKRSRSFRVGFSRPVRVGSDAFHKSCVAAAESLALCSSLYRLFYLQTEIRGRGRCRRRLTAQVMRRLRRRSHGSRNPLSDRADNERLCFPSSIFKISQTRSTWPFILRRRGTLKSWLLIKNLSVMTVGTASGTINTSCK